MDRPALLPHEPGPPGVVLGTGPEALTGSPHPPRAAISGGRRSMGVQGPGRERSEAVRGWTRSPALIRIRNFAQHLPST